MTVILDYGMGNLGSVARAIRHLGGECQVRKDIDAATRLIIPGVGAFGAAAAQLAPLFPQIRRFAEDGNPLLGICLGQQLLFEESEELGCHRGLGLFRGKVRYLPAENGIKVPHIGWNTLHWLRSDAFGEGMSSGEQTYFVHSLYTDCDDPADVAATSCHGIEFPAAVRRERVWGTQFHPEKSGAVGLRIMECFLRC